MLATPTDGVNGRRAENKSQLTARLLSAVERILDAEDANTFTELSVERLLRESGVARSTFYYHYDDKNALISALTTGILADFELLAMEWWDQPSTPTKARLRKSTERLFEFYWQHRTVMTAAAEIAAVDSAVRAQFDQMWSNIALHVAVRLRDAQRNAPMRKFDPSRTSAWLVCMTERGLYQLGRRADRAELKRLAAVHTDISWAVFYGKD
jgi:TetR/AcrR family transcriptional regulator, ethionamide resistance regulator